MGTGIAARPLEGRCIQNRQGGDPAGAVSATASMIWRPGWPLRVRFTQNPLLPSTGWDAPAAAAPAGPAQAQRDQH